MSACNFSIPFSGSPEVILDKAKSAVEGQGGDFKGDVSNGSFSISLFGNSIAGSYSVSGNNLDLVIDEKPFMVPCSAIESYLKNKLS